MTTTAAAQQQAPKLTRERLLEILPRRWWYYGTQLRAWVEKTPGDPAELWEKSERGDLLFWLSAWSGVDRKLVVLAACEVARTVVLKHIPETEKRPLFAIETAERWARGEPGVTLGDVRADAAADADAADAAAWSKTRAESLKRSAEIVHARIPWAAVEAALLQ